MTTKQFRASPFFLRNTFPSNNRWGIPTVHDETSITLGRLHCQKWIACSNTCKHEDNPTRRRCAVHHFVGDEHLPNVYANPERALEKYRQYSLVLTPDYSLYREMPQAIQVESVFRSRWMGAYWQSKGLRVIPSVSWSDVFSFEFCFEGLEKGGVVAVSTVGCRMYGSDKVAFMRGYRALLEQVHPRLVFCYGEPFIGMDTKECPVASEPYRCPRKGVA